MKKITNTGYFNKELGIIINFEYLLSKMKGIKVPLASKDKIQLSRNST